MTSPSASVNATPEMPSLCPASVITGVLVSVEDAFFARLEPSLFPSAELSSAPEPCNLAPQILSVVSKEPEATNLPSLCACAVSAARQSTLLSWPLHAFMFSTAFESMSHLYSITTWSCEHDANVASLASSSSDIQTTSLTGPEWPGMVSSFSAPFEPLLNMEIVLS